MKQLAILPLALLLSAGALSAGGRSFDEPVPETGAIGLRMEAHNFMGQVSIPAEAVYFARVAEGDEVLIGDIVLGSNLHKDGQIYLLNCPPGRYVTLGGDFSSRDARYRVLLDRSWIEKSAVDVGPNEIVFMGEFFVRKAPRGGEADDVQRIYGQLLDPRNTDSHPFLRALLTGRVTLLALGELISLDRGKRWEARFWEHAVTRVFRNSPAWKARVELRRAALSGAAAPDGEPD